MDFGEMEPEVKDVLTSMSVNRGITTAMPTYSVLTIPVRLNVLATMALQKLAINALIMMNA